MAKLTKALLAAVVWSASFFVIVFVARQLGWAFGDIDEAALIIKGAILMNIARIGWDAASA